jgi:hypothetical protein
MNPEGKDLALLSGLTQLRELEIVGSPDLTPLQDLPNLQTFLLTPFDKDPTSLKLDLGPLKKVPTLRTIYLPISPDLTIQAGALKQANPTLDIKWIPLTSPARQVLKSPADG